MRAPILPTGTVFFLLLCLAGCGGGDSNEVATTEAGGDGTTESAPDAGSDPGQMSTGGETQEGSADAGSSDAGYTPSYEAGGDPDEGGMGGPGDEGYAPMYETGDSGEEGADANLDEGMMSPEEMGGGEHDEGQMSAEEMAGGEHDEGAPGAGAPEQMYGEESPDVGDGADPGAGVSEQMYGSGANPGDGAETGPMYGDGGAGPRQAAQPKTFADMATQAFGQGRDTDAFQFLFAHAVTADDQSAGELLTKMGWIGPLKHPGLGVRWGVGIEFNAKAYNGDQLYPIGTTQQQAQTRNPRGFGQGRRDDAGGGSGGQEGMGAGPGGFGGGMQGGGGGSDAQLERFTGEVGQKVVDGLQERIARGDFGLVLKEAGSAGAPNQGRGAGGYGQMDSGAEMGDAENFGGANNAGPPGDMRGGGGNRATGRATQLVPGVTLVGLAPAKDLVTTAEQAGVDVLCVFNVAVTQIRRTGQISNNVEMQLYNVANGKKTYESGRLNNLSVQAARAKETTRGGDPVDKELEELFKEIDTNWRLAALPTSLQPEHVLARISDLLKETHQNPLPVLAEIRMYHTRGLLEDNHLLLAYQRKTNDQSGTILTSGTEEERKKVIEPWLPARGQPGGG